MSFLEVKNIQKAFGKTEVLKGIDFTLEKGEVLSIIGSSGSGKTTLLRCLNFLERPDKGNVVLDGDMIFDSAQPYRERELRKKRLHFGLVFQQFNLFPQYSALKNVYLASELILKEKLKNQDREFKLGLKNFAGGKEEKAKLKSDYFAERGRAYENNRENALKLMERVGLGDKTDSYPCQLSGGQQQRVAIARALALSPDVLCFDEPTSALDPELTGEVLKVIKGLKGSDSTMIVVTHEMEFARSVSDKVIFMAEGIIEEQGTPEEVFGNPKSEKVKAFLRKSEETE